MKLDPSQERAVELIATQRFGAVVGGPGTGKTSCLRIALDAIDDAGGTYRLAAPTGKAAQRMGEATGRAATTIHRLLDFGPDAFGDFVFRHDASNPLEVNAVVIDEASMVDVELAAALVAAIRPSRTRLILIGDADQLPSVGPGSVLADVVSSKMVPVARLTELHRAAADSWVCLNAPRVIRGETPDLAQAGDFRFVECADAGRVASEVMGLDVDQVLVPQNTGVAGVRSLNERLQEQLNPKRSEDSVVAVKETGGRNAGGYELRVGDRVIQTRNDYQLAVFNGEIGEVVEVNAKERAVFVAFPGRDEALAYFGDKLGALKLAYALTIHRSQGSEWGWVGVVCHSTHHHMLSRQLLYTALTRAKEGVVLLGDRKGLKRALANEAPSKRNTSLAVRLETIWKRTKKEVA